MKKLWFILLAVAIVTGVVLVLLLLPAEKTINGDIILPSSGRITYTLSDDGTYYIVSDCDITGDAVIIGATYKGLPVKEIGYMAFNLSEKLSEVILPDTITTISDGAFYWCTSLTNITIPDSVTKIGKTAFYNCTKLSGNIHLPAALTSIGELAFASCPQVESFTVAEDNPKFEAKGNCVIEKATKTLIAGCKNSVIPADGSVTVIGNNAFRNCYNLKSIEIPETVTTIDGWAFYCCFGLESVIIPDSVTTVGYDAFANLTEKTTIYCEAERPGSNWRSGWNSGSKAIIKRGYKPEKAGD